MLIKVGTYSKDLKDRKRLKGPKRPKPASLKCERLGFRALSPTRKPKSLARPVPTLLRDGCFVAGLAAIGCVRNVTM